jgi:hypothetical protein
MKFVMVKLFWISLLAYSIAGLFAIYGKSIDLSSAIAGMIITLAEEWLNNRED